LQVFAIAGGFALQLDAEGEPSSASESDVGATTAAPTVPSANRTPIACGAVNDAIESTGTLTSAPVISVTIIKVVTGTREIHDAATRPGMRSEH
jgi:hypothetical protein